MTAYVADSSQRKTSRFKSKQQKHIIVEILNLGIIREKVLIKANEEARKVKSKLKCVQTLVTLSVNPLCLKVHIISKSLLNCFLVAIF